MCHPSTWPTGSTVKCSNYSSWAADEWRCRVIWLAGRRGDKQLSHRRPSSATSGCPPQRRCTGATIAGESNGCGVETTWTCWEQVKWRLMRRRWPWVWIAERRMVGVAASSLISDNTLSKILHTLTKKWSLNISVYTVFLSWNVQWDHIANFFLPVVPLFFYNLIFSLLSLTRITSTQSRCLAADDIGLISAGSSIDFDTFEHGHVCRLHPQIT
jgi:hypothetical protein